MTINFDGYQVEIKAKSLTTMYKGSGKYNEADTKYLLNHIICALNDASIFNENQGFKYTALRLSDEASSIYDQIHK